MNYEEDLTELIDLLSRASEEHWENYFKVVLNLYLLGKVKKSYKKSLGAFGGMGSFNDLTLNFITDAEVAKVESIRDSLWLYCKKV